MTAPAAKPLGSQADAQKLLGHLCDIMDALLGTIEEETEHVRAGRLREAAELEWAKAELASLYLADTARVKANADYIAGALPDLLDDVRKRHETFQALLQINLTVLATAHAVSESIVRGVAGEMARKAAPQTYGASGRQSAPTRSAVEPVALSRTL